MLLNNAGKRLQAKERRFIKLYANMLLNGNVDFDKLGKIYRPDDLHPEWKAKRVLKSRYIQDMTAEEIVKIYNSQGITSETVIKEEKSILDEAKTAGNLRIQLDVVNNWRESLDFKPKQQQVTSTQTDYLRLIDKDKQVIEAKRETKQLKSDADEQK